MMLFLFISAAFAAQGTMPAFCATYMSLSACSGKPSASSGEICMWNGEDMKCVSVESDSNLDDLCKQYAYDPTACGAHKECFWDSEDAECTSVAERGYVPVQTGTGVVNTGTTGTGVATGGTTTSN